jgi:thiamine pyrophosphate-dependent acetolactate synthase large subunit-like protein
MSQSSETPNYKLLAKAFAEEGVDIAFHLMGDGNMYWATSLTQDFGVKAIHARHENCVVAMADAYARATGTVGIASVTCGPGFTPTVTSLTAAARGNVPLIVFAGDTPITDLHHLQAFDIGPVAEKAGARYIPLRHPDRMFNDVREAFYTARYEHVPVVLGVPVDIQAAPAAWGVEYIPSADLMPRPQRSQPDPELVREAAKMLSEAERPVVIAGHGALRSGAVPDLTALAEHAGALVATSLRAKGAFHNNPFNLDVSGSFASPYAHELFAEADLVLSAGAGLGSYTTEAGYLFPNAKVIQIDTRPRGLWQGNRTADLHLAADAKAGAQAITAELNKLMSKRTGFRRTDIAERLTNDVHDDKPFQLEPNTLDPREAVYEIDRVIPKDWDIVMGCAHYFTIAGPMLRGRPANRYHFLTEFGAIGQALPAAVGVAAARGNGKVCLIEGDGSLLMQIQELETIARHGIKLLIISFNDGAYGAEIHKLIPRGVSPTEATFGRPNLAAVSQAFGLRGVSVTETGKLSERFEQHERGETASLWDLHISKTVPSISYRRVHFGEV